MGFWNKIMGALGGGSGGGSEGGGSGKSRQLPSTMVAKEFGEVNVLRKGGQLEISLTILMEPQGAEGWQTGIALDASGSMQGVYGKGLEDKPGVSQVPQSTLDDYRRRGWLQMVEHQGKQYPVLSDEAKKDLVTRGYFKWSTNEVEPLARKLTSYLASNLDADGGTTVLYWACGDGSQTELIGDLTAEDCEKAIITGPKDISFGEGTVLTPAVRYFADRFADAKQGIYIFLTDGELHDLDEVKRYTIQLCKEIAAKKRNPLKCVLIGIGEAVNEGQMEELDDLDSGTSVDIWDHKIAKDMRSLVEIFAEVVNENQIIAPFAKIYDDKGQIVKNYTDGLPAKISFTLPETATAFELEVGGQRVRQSVVEPK
jgi:hypothetical protein